MTHKSQLASYQTPLRLNSPLHKVFASLFVFMLSYFAASLAGLLVLRPQMIWPLWPGCALLVAILLLTARRNWPLLLLVGLAGFALYDLREGLAVRSIALLLAGDSVEILIAALGVNYVFHGVPQLNSVTSLAKYCFFAVIVAPIAVASVAVPALEEDSWWIGFFTEALALLTLTPAILGLVNIARRRVKKPKLLYLEAASMFLALAILAYVILMAPGSEYRPALLYLLVPFLLWAALRFGITGTTNSLVLVAMFAILGVAHNHGPFTGHTPLKDVLSLQVFLLVAASSFMVLAAVVEKHEAAEQTVRRSEERLRLAQQAAVMGTFEWNMRTGVNTWTAELEAIYGLPQGGFGGTQTAFENLIHSDDRAALIKVVELSVKTGKPTIAEWRAVWPDGSVHWIAGRWQVLIDESGEPSRVVGVNIDVTQRKRAEEALLEVNRSLEAQAALLQSREDLLKIFVKNVPAGVAMLDRDMRYLQVSDRWCADYSVDSSQVLGRSHYELFPDMPRRWKEVHRRALDGETLRADEDRWDREDGTTWVCWEIRPWRTPNGLVGGILIFAEEITHRKQMEEAISGMSRRLIESQERERTRIARELHDDIVQRLSLLAIRLQQLQKSADLPPEVRSHTGELWEQTTEIATDVQHLSHELHSSRLQYLGLAVAMRGFCREFGEQQNMEIDFQTHDLPSPLSADISLCFFRVLQEALHNSAKHSGARHFEVRLWATSDDIHLTVRDSGVGFDPEAAKRSQGLGLISMEERLKILKGSLSMDSQPKRGTTIHACAPLTSGSDFMRAAG
jgi:PAS domain S-box-containing protein